METISGTLVTVKDINIKFVNLYDSITKFKCNYYKCCYITSKILKNVYESTSTRCALRLDLSYADSYGNLIMNVMTIIYEPPFIYYVIRFFKRYFRQTYGHRKLKMYWLNVVFKLYSLYLSRHPRVKLM